MTDISERQSLRLHLMETLVELCPNNIWSLFLVEGLIWQAHREQDVTEDEKDRLLTSLAAEEKEQSSLTTKDDNSLSNMVQETVRKLVINWADKHTEAVQRDEKDKEILETLKHGSSSLPTQKFQAR